MHQRFEPSCRLTVRKVLTSIVVIVLIVVSVPGRADQVITLPNHDCAFGGTFSQSKQVDGLTEPIRSSGFFYYSCTAGVVWKTADPIVQTLVFKQSGGAFSVQDQQVNALKTAPMKVLGRLLNDLMGADVGKLENQFMISSIAPSEQVDTIAAGEESEAVGQQIFSLLPRHRKIKRGIKRLELAVETRSASAAERDTIKRETLEQSALAPADINLVTIAILDRKDQWTRIATLSRAQQAKQDQADPVALEEELPCRYFLAFTERECATLHAEPG